MYIYNLRTQTLRVTREQRSQANVRQSQEEHDNPVQTQATTSVRRASLTESIEVVLESFLVRVNTFSNHRSLQFLNVVDTLGTGHDLLTTHEEVIRVGEAGVLGVGFGVEGAHGHGELVENVEVGVVLVADDLAQLLLHRGAEVVLEAFLFRDVDAGFLEQVHTVHVGQAQGLAVLGELEVTGLGVRLLDGFDLLAVAHLELREDKNEEVLSELEDFVVVASESFFEIKTGELDHQLA